MTSFGDRRTLHMGIDIFAPAGTELASPLDGTVLASEVRNNPGDYGGVILLEHSTPNGTPFWLLLGHLSHESAIAAPVGRRVKAGETIAAMGIREENGGWDPHLHVQLFTSLLGKQTDLDGVARVNQGAVWSSISPNPAPLLVGVPRDAITAPNVLDDRSIIRMRRSKLSSSLSTSYRRPLHMVRGDGSHLIDADGKRWLDLVNNVAHVGHEHPHVVESLIAQARLLNTNTRYLHPRIVEYAERLSALFPEPLSVAMFTNSGSEALDLALRLARTATGRTGTLVMDWAYHGNLTSLIALSPYKFNRPGGSGQDEVQCGMGRVGDAWSAFETHGVVPDIVTIGKPIGNGHPMGAVITTPEVARAFRNGMEYFNTFGGNPVSCSVGLAVLDVIRDERLVANAELVGRHLVAGLDELAGQYEFIGDVRGRGLFLGVDVVRDRESKKPDPDLAAQVVEGVLGHGILISSDGPDNNVLKIKPPMVFTVSEADLVIQALDDVFGSTNPGHSAPACIDSASVHYG